MGACYDWIGLLVQQGLLLKERQQYSISSQFIVIGIELLNFWVFEALPGVSQG